MSRTFIDWVVQEPRPSAQAVAVRLARSRFWRDGNERFIGTHPDWPDAAYFLDLEETFAHAFVLVLSAMPASDRLAFAEAYYDMRRSTGVYIEPDPIMQLSMSAAIVLLVVDVIDRPEICTERLLDLVHGAAQGDDLTNAPPAAVDEVARP